MLLVPCDCGSFLELNPEVTLATYLETLTNKYCTDDLILKLAPEDLDFNTMRYTCLGCGKIVDLTYKDIETRIRSYLIEQALITKKKPIIQKYVDFTEVDSDKGLFYCGKCAGIDNEGNCFKDLKNKCNFRKHV
jgi:hypothetical protein